LRGESTHVEVPFGTSTFLVHTVPVKDAHDAIVGGMVMTQDITERVQAEAEREQLFQAAQHARRAAEAALAVRAQFLSIASHELRTPITPLLGYASMLRQSMANGPETSQRKLVETIERQAIRLNTLIESLLDVSRLQQGMFTLEVQPLDLGALAAQVVDEFRQTLPGVGGHAITLLRPDETLSVLADASRLEEVLHNLLSNAVKYSSPETHIRVRTVRQDGEAVLEVSDEGIGIPVDEQKRLFAPFYRASNVGPLRSGFGIGLYLVHEIVEQHGGRVELESNDGQGTTVRVALPMHAE
jgi:signal transduction histidine kinase